MALVTLGLDRCLVVVDVYGSKGWQAFAPPAEMLAVLLTGIEKNLVFLAWTRGVMFQASDGYAVLIPCVDPVEKTLGLHVRRLNLTARECVDAGCEMFRMIDDACEVCLDDLHSQALFMLKENLDKERESMPQSWWKAKEPICLWQPTGYIQRDLLTRTATMIMLDGLLPMLPRVGGTDLKIAPLAN